MTTSCCVWPLRSSECLFWAKKHDFQFLGSDRVVTGVSKEWMGYVKEVGSSSAPIEVKTFFSRPDPATQVYVYWHDDLAFAGLSRPFHAAEAYLLTLL